MSGNNNDNRAELIAGLRAMAQFLEEHPELPMPFGVDAHPFLGNLTDEAGNAEVDRIAGILGETPEAGHSYSVSRSFGGGVVYEAYKIPSRKVEQYQRDISYHGSVTP